MIHALLLFLLAWGLSTQTARNLLPAQEVQKDKEPEVTFVFPEQFIPEPEPVIIEEKQRLFIDTSSNEAAAVAPVNADFQSDRNTFAASEKPAVANSTSQMPTLDGTGPSARELATREYKDGGMKKIMEEMDGKIERAGGARLPLEVRKADSSTQDKTLPEPVPSLAALPQVRMPEDTPPEMAPAAPADIPAMREASDPEEEEFSSLTRMAKSDGSISQEGQDAVNAVATPMATYTRQVKSAIEEKWRLYTDSKKSPSSFGSVTVRFYVDKKGVPQNMEIISDPRDADVKMRDLTLEAILDADIPPIPADTLTTPDQERVEITYNFLILQPAG